MKTSQKLFLHDMHNEQSAKFINFADYRMPLSYKLSTSEEHLWVRSKCGIFDVSHMGQYLFQSDNPESFFNYITPTNFINTKVNKSKYSVFLNEDSQIIDDFIATKLSPTSYFVVLNASRKNADLHWLSKYTKKYSCNIKELQNNSLLSIQGPLSQKILSNILNIDINIDYMSSKYFFFNKQKILISRTGYTGEHGYEVSIADPIAPIFFKALLNDCDVRPIGVGARDSLRLEAGYPLYGADIGKDFFYADSSLAWLHTNKENFLASKAINQTKNIRRVGLKLIDKGVLRAGYEVFDENLKDKIGFITSGCYSPLLKQSIGQCYIKTDILLRKPKKVFVKIRNSFKRVSLSRLNFINLK